MIKLPVVACSLGLVVMVTQTAIDSNTVSYISDSPEACVNCHNMRSAYNSWRHSSHRETTNCNSCHVPHTSIVEKYAFKAADGLRHSIVFTLGKEPQNPMLNSLAETVVKKNCQRCHQSVLKNLQHASVSQRLCWDCHPSVPHGKLRSISSSSSAVPMN